jgi:hypothetical protein
LGAGAIRYAQKGTALSTEEMLRTVEGLWIGDRVVFFCAAFLTHTSGLLDC